MSQQAIPILTLPLTLTGAVTASRFVTAAGAQAGADANTLGVSRSTGAIAEKVPVDVLGSAVVEAGAAVAAGATIKSDASGRAITWVTSGAKVGLALEAAGAAGQFIEVLLIPNVA
jgi:Uncharacterized conserved protein (DUF2190)